MTWLHQVNSLNKMRARVYPSQPLKGSLFGFNFILEVVFLGSKEQALF
jgi:hypothetical protein